MSVAGISSVLGQCYGWVQQGRNMFRCLLLALFLAPLSTLGYSRAFAADRNPACRATQPPDPPFDPPILPFPLHAMSEAFWYGNESLWTTLYVPGIWKIEGNVLASKGAYATKLFYWSRDFDWRMEPEPNLIVNAKRLDRKRPLVRADHATNAFSGEHAGMLVGLDVPTTGCWEITAHYRQHTLAYVVLVEP